MKAILFFSLFFMSASLYADPLWDSAVSLYGKYKDSKPAPKSAYILFESGAPGASTRNEIWEEYRYEAGTQYRKVIRVVKNGVEQPMPDEAKDKWLPPGQKKKKKMDDYNGIDEIFYASKQKNVKYRRTGKTKEVYGKTCAEYSFEYTKFTRGKKETVPGKAYIDEETGAPCEIRRHNTSKYMKGSPDSFIVFSYDGSHIYTRHVMLIMNINFFGKQSNMKSEFIMEY